MEWIHTPNASVMWLGAEVKRTINAEMRTRVRRAIVDLKQKVHENISVPVVFDGSGNVIQRSLPGEYPRMETGQLQKGLTTSMTLFSNGVIEGYVGSQMDYSIPLEVNLDREFLGRTLREQWQSVSAALVREIV